MAALTRVTSHAGCNEEGDSSNPRAARPRMFSLSSDTVRTVRFHRRAHLAERKELVRRPAADRRDAQRRDAAAGGGSGGARHAVAEEATRGGALEQVVRLGEALEALEAQVPFIGLHYIGLHKITLLKRRYLSSSNRDDVPT